MSIQVQGRVQALYGVYAAVVLSEEGRTFGEILYRLKADNNKVREDKVGLYEERIAAGDYYVAGRDIAAKMLDQRI